jgi:hippurate hydrolase
MHRCLALACLAYAVLTSVAAGDEVVAAVDRRLASEAASLDELYRHLHAHPELSFHEEQTSRRMAEELRACGFEVTEKVGGWGVVGVLRNGPGRTVLVRADMDALPVRELTGLPFASRVKATDDSGKEVPVMHACGHDVHMTCWTGTARVLAAERGRWQGTLVFIAQPAEERGGGARAMLADGLFERFPKPDLSLALHCSADLPAGQIGITPGGMTASVDNLDIVVHGVGGHGAQPQATKDPVVIASQIVLALQTIASRETHPLDAVVVTVGSFQAGTKHNIIPDQARLQLTVRATREETRTRVLDSIRRISRGIGLAAGLPEDLLPEVILGDEFTPVLLNDEAFTRRLRGRLETVLGKDAVSERPPSMVGEDFARYGKTEERRPICMFWLGVVPEAKYRQAQENGAALPSLHSPFFRPDATLAVRTGAKALVMGVLEGLQVKVAE